MPRVLNIFHKKANQDKQNPTVELTKTQAIETRTKTQAIGTFGPIKSASEGIRTGASKPKNKVVERVFREPQKNFFIRAFDGETSYALEFPNPVLYSPESICSNEMLQEAQYAAMLALSDGKRIKRALAVIENSFEGYYRSPYGGDHLRAAALYFFLVPKKYHTHEMSHKAAEGLAYAYTNGIDIGDFIYDISVRNSAEYVGKLAMKKYPKAFSGTTFPPKVEKIRSYSDWLNHSDPETGP